MWEGGVGWVLSCSFCFWFFHLCFYPLFSSVAFFKWLEHDNCCVCFFVFYFFFLSLLPLTRSYWCTEIVVCHVKLFRKSVSDLYSVDFLAEGRVFKLASLFRMSTLIIDIVIKLLDRVYHFSLLICYRCSSSLLLSVTYLFI